MSCKITRITKFATPLIHRGLFADCGSLPMSSDEILHVTESCQRPWRFDLLFLSRLRARGQQAGDALDRGKLEGQVDFF